MWDMTLSQASENQRPSVFIVDDDAAVRDAVKFLVQSFGWQAEGFDSGEAFLRVYTPGRPACLVLDLHMPRMNGVELQNHLRARGYRIPVIVITAQPDDSLVAQAKRAGALSVLQKPFNNQELMHNILRAIGPIGEPPS